MNLKLSDVLKIIDDLPIQRIPKLFNPFGILKEFIDKEELKSHLKAMGKSNHIQQFDICECGHKRPESIILDNNELSIAFWMEYWEQAGKLCWDCFCKQEEKR